MRNLHYTIFYMKTNLLQSFHIYISVPLNYVFLLDASMFTTIDGKKKEQKSTLQLFLKDVTQI